MTHRKATICIVGHNGAGVKTTIGCLLYKLGAVDTLILEKLQKAGITQYSSIPAYFAQHNIRKAFETPTLDLEIVDADSNTNPDLTLLVVSDDTMSTIQTTVQSLPNLLPGCKRLVILINKMDSANWDQTLFNNLRQRLDDQLSSKPDIDYDKLRYVPFCALTGENLLAISSRIPWYHPDRGVDATGMEHGTVIEALSSMM